MCHMFDGIIIDIHYCGHSISGSVTKADLYTKEDITDFFNRLLNTFIDELNEKGIKTVQKLNDLEHTT